MEVPIMTAAQANGEVLFANLPALVEGGFTSARGIGAGWVSFTYRAGGVDGVGLATGAGSGAGEVVLNLGLRGWHDLRFVVTPALLVWLDGEPDPRELRGYAEGSLLRDFPIPPVDLTGKRLHIAPRAGAEPSEAMLFALRAIPCSGPRKSSRNLIATNDGHGCILGYENLRDVYVRSFSPLRDTDFFRMIWGVYGGGPLTIRAGATAGEIIDRPSDHAYYAYERRWGAAIDEFKRRGEDVVAAAVDAAHRIGLEIHLYVRPEAFYRPFPHEACTVRFFRDHPEWRCRDETGREVRRMSYAYPEVQEHMLAYFAELLDYEAEGLCLAFNRSIPMMICEEPVLAEFRRRWGRAARLPDEVDAPEMLEVRHDLLAGFIGRVHELVRGRGKVLSCIIPRDLADVRLRGLDVERSIRAGHFESVMVGGGHGDPQTEILDELTRLQALGTRVYSGGSAGGANGAYWLKNDPRLIAERMLHLLEAGLGGYFWDVDAWFSPCWELVSRCGDREFLRDYLAGRVPRLAWETTAMNGMPTGRYSPWKSY